MPSSLRVLRRTLCALVATTVFVGTPRSLTAELIEVGSGVATPGGSSEICVQLSDGAGKVAAVQMDFSWDPQCMSANMVAGNSGDCRSTRKSTKNVSTLVKPNATMRAIMFSIFDMSPIPDGELFCCTFTLAASPPSQCCRIGISKVMGSTRANQAIPEIPAHGGQLCLAPGSAGAQVPAAQPPVAQPPAAAGSEVSAPAPAPPVAAPPMAVPQARQAPAPTPAQPGAAPAPTAAPARDGAAAGPAPPVGLPPGLPEEPAAGELPAAPVGEVAAPAPPLPAATRHPTGVTTAAVTPHAPTPRLRGTPTAALRTPPAAGSPTARSLTQTPGPAATQSP